GAPSTMRMNIVAPNPPAGTAATTAVVVQMIDADGSTIIGPYAKAVTLSDSDGTGATKLSTTTLTDSESVASLSYSGVIFSSATIQAAAPGLTPVHATFAPEPTAIAEYPVQGWVNGAGFSPVTLVDIAYGLDGNMWAVGEGYAEILKISHDG